MDTILDSLTLEQAKEMIAKQDDRIDEQKARIAELEKSLENMTGVAGHMATLLMDKNKELDTLRAASLSF